jgi:hypothetical protein
MSAAKVMSEHDYNWVGADDGDDSDGDSICDLNHTNHQNLDFDMCEQDDAGMDPLACEDLDITCPDSTAQEWLQEGEAVDDGGLNYM